MRMLTHGDSQSLVPGLGEIMKAKNSSSKHSSLPLKSGVCRTGFMPIERHGAVRLVKMNARQPSDRRIASPIER